MFGDSQLWDEELKTSLLPAIIKVMVDGAVTELATAKRRFGKASTATEYMEGLDETVGILTEQPDWLQNAIRGGVEETFQASYWEGINDTTRNYVKGVIDKGVTEGLSVAQLAKRLRDELGEEYNRARSMNIARTESAAALNAGHDFAIGQLEHEIGMVVGKEWASALTDTTRESHADMDMTVVPAKGLFNLNGVLVPYPAHFLLPPGDRCNCLCMVMEAFIMEEQ